jgi:hypothetical protein
MAETEDVIAVGAVGFIDAHIAVPVEPPLVAEPVCKVCVGITVVPTLLVTRIWHSYDQEPVTERQTLMV